MTGECLPALGETLDTYEPRDFMLNCLFGRYDRDFYWKATQPSLSGRFDTMLRAASRELLVQSLAISNSRCAIGARKPIRVAAESATPFQVANSEQELGRISIQPRIVAEHLRIIAVLNSPTDLFSDAAEK